MFTRLLGTSLPSFGRWTNDFFRYRFAPPTICLISRAMFRQKADAVQDNWEKQAQKLIFGSRKYEDFSGEEKKIVDAYQERVFETFPLFLPNTGADLERKRIEQMKSELHSE